MKTIFKIILFSVSAFLISCTTVNTPQTTQNWSGRFVVVAIPDNDSLGYSGYFNLQNTGKEQFLALQNSLSITLAQLHITPTATTLDIAGEEPQSDTLANSLLEKNLGFTIPFDCIFSWLKGSPLESKPYKYIKKTNSYVSFKQGNWTIEASNKDFSGRFHKLSFKQTSPLVRIRLIITEFPNDL